MFSNIYLDTINPNANYGILFTTPVIVSIKYSSRVDYIKYYR